MKKIPLLIMFLIVWTGWAQQSPEVSVENAVTDFFEAFHARDSAALRKLVTPEIRMQTVGRSTAGADSVLAIPFGRFLERIVSFPDSVEFEERLRSVSVKVDGNLAQAWTPYEFWIDGVLSHCGANAFQLFRQDGSWKILSIIDTRRKEGCSD